MKSLLMVVKYEELRLKHRVRKVRNNENHPERHNPSFKKPKKTNRKQKEIMMRFSRFSSILSRTLLWRFGSSRYQASRRGISFAVYSLVGSPYLPWCCTFPLWIVGKSWEGYENHDASSLWYAYRVPWTGYTCIPQRLDQSLDQCRWEIPHPHEYFHHHFSKTSWSSERTIIKHCHSFFRTVFSIFLHFSKCSSSWKTGISVCTVHYRPGH